MAPERMCCMALLGAGAAAAGVEAGKHELFDPDADGEGRDIACELVA